MFLDVALLGSAGILALITFLFKRAAGQAIFAMMAGAFAAQLGAASFTSWLDGQGIEFTLFSLQAGVAVLFVLLPFIVIWLTVGKSHESRRQIVGSIIVGIVGAALLLDHMPAIFQDNQFAQAHADDLMVKWHDAIILGGFVFALLDILLSKSPHKKPQKHSR